MRTIAVMARKGGSGKTTLSLHLALAAHLRGQSAMLADADPQASAFEVLKGRAASGPQVTRTTGPKLFTQQLAAGRAGVDTLVIDTPAVLEEELSYAIIVADLSILVVRPTFLDIAAALRTADIIRQLRKPGLIVLNQAPIARAGHEPPTVRKALEALAYMRLPIAPVIIRSRAAFQQVMDSGRSVEELTPPTAAGEEIAALWDLVCKALTPA